MSLQGSTPWQYHPNNRQRDECGLSDPGLYCGRGRYGHLPFAGFISGHDGSASASHTRSDPPPCSTQITSDASKLVFPTPHAHHFHQSPLSGSW